MDIQIYLFGLYALDVAGARLLRDGHTVPLTPKALAVLRYLVEQRGRLVDKNELLDAVWRRRFVSEGVLKNTVQTLRQALDDDPKSPRYIETVHRLGYRFVAEVATAPPGVPPAASASAADFPSMPHWVGRANQLAELRRLLEKARRGEPQIVFVSGEPGIGKTTLIHAFMAQSAEQALNIHGQCVGQYGHSEPYLPLLEAINQLARLGGAACVRQLRQYAPTWLAQMPWLMEEADRERLQRETQGVTKDRMLRELGEFLRGGTEARPLILTIEDIHWSDHATVDAITYLARRRGGARLLLLGSYRPADVAVNDHPFRLARSELLLHGLCCDLALEPLSELDVRQYLRQRFPDRDISDTLAQAVFRRSEGLPLFFTRIADEMEAMPATGAIEPVLATLPDGLKQLIEHQLERFSARERQWLDIAAVCGEDFPAAAVAGTCGDAVADVDTWCECQVRARYVLQYSERHAESRYRFIHAYYQELAYARLAPSRKTALHAALAFWYEAHSREKAGEMAAELAEHFERGGQYERASLYLHQAALNALSRHATFEASELLQRGLKLLDEHLPDEPAYLRRKLDFLTLLPATLVATRGYTLPELETLYHRALALTERLADSQAQFVTLYWIWMYYLTCCGPDTALAKAKQLFTLAETTADPVLLLIACYAIGTTLMFRGDHLGCDAWLKRGLGHVTDAGHIKAELVRAFAQDPIACSWAQLAITRHMLGDGDSVLTLMQRARDRAEQLGDPYTQTLMQIYVFWLHANRREPEQVRAHLPRIEQLSATHGFPLFHSLAQIYRNWLAATVDDDPSGIETVSHIIDNLQSTGTRLGLSNYLLLLADAYLHHGQYESGLHVIEDGLAKMRDCGERRYEAKFWLLRGELLARQGLSVDETVKACFETALAIADPQHARYLALRAACRLVELAKDDGETANAKQRLADIYGQFSEGFETQDLRTAQALLDVPRRALPLPT